MSSSSLYPDSALALAAEYGQAYRGRTRPVGPSASTDALREKFCIELTDRGPPAAAVIQELIAAAEPGLVGNTDPNFYAWVMGGSDPVGVAADWLSAIWGQNAAIYQSSPAAAIAEEAVEAWLLELLDLPRDSSVGFVSGATTAAFVGLAAARGEVLRRAGHDIDRDGLQRAPLVRIYLSEDAHVTNYVVLRQLGFGEANFHRLSCDAAGLMDAADLDEAMAGHDGPKIVLAQAGHINSGGFESLEAIAEIAQANNAWMHIDGAFGLWARALKRKKHLAKGAELADSWSVDGHKWLQIPYDSGFAIVRHKEAHFRAMQKSAGYLNVAPNEGRTPSNWVPGLSRRAQGFAAWAVIRSLGRAGVAELIDRHCNSASLLKRRIECIDGLSVLNKVDLNQLVIGSNADAGEDWKITALADRLTSNHPVFLKTAEWNGRTVLRISIISRDTRREHAEALAVAIKSEWELLRNLMSKESISHSLQRSHTLV
ncbi:aspartate aminotransferase family protein [Hyphomonas sp.]|uniref:pyridoxal phosphate-dependent decarboxylase family protein n=1 Tax=Hyphomonas sp. TaxID=87 RepID=UPI003527974D